jgi:hypothetical protein
MLRHFFLENFGVSLAFATLVFSWWLYSRDTDMFGASFFAALLTAFFVWIAYVLIKWVVLAFIQKPGDK